MHTILRCTIVAHFTDKISVYFTHFLAKISNSSRNFFFQLLPVLILRQNFFSFDWKITLSFIFSSFMYLPSHRHCYANLSIQPVKMHIISHKQINHCPDKKAAIQNFASKKTPFLSRKPAKGRVLNSLSCCRTNHSMFVSAKPILVVIQHGTSSTFERKNAISSSQRST